MALLIFGPLESCKGFLQSTVRGFPQHTLFSFQKMTHTISPTLFPTRKRERESSHFQLELCLSLTRVSCWWCRVSPRDGVSRRERGLCWRPALGGPPRARLQHVGQIVEKEKPVSVRVAPHVGDVVLQAVTVTHARVQRELRDLAGPVGVTGKHWLWDRGRGLGARLGRLGDRHSGIICGSVTGRHEGERERFDGGRVERARPREVQRHHGRAAHALCAAQSAKKARPRDIFQRQQQQQRDPHYPQQKLGFSHTPILYVRTQLSPKLQSLTHPILISLSLERERISHLRERYIYAQNRTTQRHTRLAGATPPSRGDCASFAAKSRPRLSRTARQALRTPRAGTARPKCRNLERDSRFEIRDSRFEIRDFVAFSKSICGETDCESSHRPRRGADRRRGPAPPKDGSARGAFPSPTF